jgi:DNA-binding phage protein
MARYAVSKSRRDLDKIFEDIIAMLYPMNEAALKHLALKADVSKGTLYTWKYGPTCFPRLHTIIKVARALGYDVKLVRSTNKPTLTRIK